VSAPHASMTVAEFLAWNPPDGSDRWEDGAWPDNPIALTLGDDVALESIDFAAPITAFYRTA
jgi:hypothetical protein